MWERDNECHEPNSSSCTSNTETKVFHCRTSVQCEQMRFDLNQMNNLGALGVVVMTYEQNTNDDTILYSLDDDESDLYNVNMAE